MANLENSKAPQPKKNQPPQGKRPAPANSVKGQQGSRPPAQKQGGAPPRNAAAGQPTQNQKPVSQKKLPPTAQDRTPGAFPSFFSEAFDKAQQPVGRTQGRPAAPQQNAAVQKPAQNTARPTRPPGRRGQGAPAAQNAPASAQSPVQKAVPASPQAASPKMKTAPAPQPARAPQNERVLPGIPKAPSPVPPPAAPPAAQPRPPMRRPAPGMQAHRPAEMLDGFHPPRAGRRVARPSEGMVQPPPPPQPGLVRAGRPGQPAPPRPQRPGTRQAAPGRPTMPPSPGKGKKGKGNKPPRPRRTKLMVTLNILLICAALLMGTLGAGLIYTDNMMSLVGTGAEEEFQGISGEIDFSQGESENPNFQNVAALDAVDSTSTLRSDPMVQNILMLGSDKREGKGETGWRADTQIILSIDHRHKTLKMTSILRDTYVHIPGGHQDNRINTAFAYGGAPLAMKAIESNFGIKIDRYVTVNFRIFEKIVDIIGGIDLEISAGEAKEINNRACPFGHPPVSEGFVHLNGRQTLEYSRIRKIDDDFARTSRQRKVLELMLEHFRSLSLTQVNELLYKTLPLISTNLSQEEILSLCGQVGTLLKYPLETMSVPASGTWEGKNIRGMSVLVANMQENRRLMAQFIFESGLSKYYGNTYSGYTYGFGYGNGYGYSYYSTRIPEENSTGDGEGPHSDEAKTQ